VRTVGNGGLPEPGVGSTVCIQACTGGCTYLGVYQEAYIAQYTTLGYTRRHI